jgi:xanthine dehydrogenase YagR molybdenum-binding subunit
MSILEDAKQLAQGVAQAAMAKAVALAPDSWIPGGEPDPLIEQRHGHVGKPVSRLDGPLKVTGGAPFAAEFQMDGMVYAAVAYSTVAKGRIAELDTAAAEAASGVVLVMTHRNAPRLRPTPVFLSAQKASGGDALPVMQDGQIHWNGQPLAVVLADTQERADHAKSLIRIACETEDAATDFEQAQRRGTRTARFMGQPLHDAKGDAEVALAKAPVKVDALYTTQRHNHNPIELHAVTLAWQGGTLRVYDTQQMVAHCAWTLTKVFDIAQDQVVVTSPFVGGGFGSKTLWQHHILAAAAAKLAGRPVRLILSREGVYRVVGGRSPTQQRVALGANPDGRLTALIHTGTTVKTAHNAMPEPFILPTHSAYAAETMLLDVQQVELDMVSNTFMRARLARRSAPSRWNARWTNSPMSSASTRSNCASATSPRKTRLRACPSRRAISSRPGRRGPSASAGAGAIHGRAQYTTANGSSAWAVRPRPIPITACRVERPG